jgi:hypothetical protein|tara:strand:+ start:578 stop:730 length:153 start_codon:yes stop_codon:yes gene_type:complete
LIGSYGGSWLLSDFGKSMKDLLVCLYALPLAMLLLAAAPSKAAEINPKGT